MADIDTLLAEYRAVTATGRVHRKEEANAAIQRGRIVHQMHELGYSYAAIGRLIDLTRDRARQLAIRASQ